MRYKRLSQDLFTDTLEVSVPSRQQERYAQVFSASSWWARAFPMKRKGNAPDALDLLFHQDGVPPKMVMDGSKEQTQGRKLKLAHVHEKQTEPYSRWQCDAKNIVVHELK